MQENAVRAGSCWSVRRWATPGTPRPGCARCWPARTWSPPRTPGGWPGWPGTSASRSRGRIVSYFEGNEERRTPELVEALRGGAVVAVVTDGGMPSVSDPGYRLVRAALDAGFPVTAAPGPSAVTTALALSGLPSDRFCFEGFLPRTGSGRRSRLRELAAEPRTLVFFEAPHRITGALADLAGDFGADRRGRGLPGADQDVRGDPPRAARPSWPPGRRGEPRGEITVVVAGAPAGPAERPADDELRAAVAAARPPATTRRDAIQAVADDVRPAQTRRATRWCTEPQ